MILFQFGLVQWYKRFLTAFKLSTKVIVNCKFSNINIPNSVQQMRIVGPESLTICLLTSCFVGMVFTLQVAKEFLYLDATSIIGAILTIAFTRELSPVLTSVILVGRIGSSFTAEIATMQITEQIDALYVLRSDPISYIVFPRLLACILMLPLLNIIALATSLSSSIFICFTLYNIHPSIFLTSAYSSLSSEDIFKSLLKAVIFGFIIASISCTWGLTTTGGAKGVGQSTTSSVVTSLLTIFVVDFVLSYLMFHNLDSAIKTLS